MLVVGAANALNTLHSRFIANMATERVARIGRVDDEPTTIDDGNRLLNQASLRVVRVDFKKLRHKQIRKVRKAIIQEISWKKTTIIIIFQINQLGQLSEKTNINKREICSIFTTKIDFVVFF